LGKNEKLQSKNGKKDLQQPPPLSKTTSATRATHQNDRLNQARPTVSKSSPETHYWIDSGLPTQKTLYLHNNYFHQKSQKKKTPKRHRHCQ
jgi:hypothetical protein